MQKDQNPIFITDYWQKRKNGCMCKQHQGAMESTFFLSIHFRRELLFQVKLGHCQHKITDYINVIFQQAGLWQKKNKYYDNYML